jgi:hypothetical protein
MNLTHILKRIAEGLIYVDKNSDIHNSSRNGIKYLPGLTTIYEPQCADELMKWWVKKYPEDFHSPYEVYVNYSYPDHPGNKCDILFTSDVSKSGKPEWAIELKKIAFLGDNGKNNDYGPSKLISPFLKDRSVAHDVIKLHEADIARKKAVIGYGFNYSEESLNIALQKHPKYADRIKTALKIVKSGGTLDNELDLEPLLEIADFIVQKFGFVKPLVTIPFSDAWRHPMGGNGTIFAWEFKSTT